VKKTTSLLIAGCLILILFSGCIIQNPDTSNTSSIPGISDTSSIGEEKIYTSEKTFKTSGSIIVFENSTSINGMSFEVQDGSFEKSTDFKIIFEKADKLEFPQNR
jgi:hypothetical protein